MIAGKTMKVSAGPADIVAFERAYGLGFGQAFGDIDKMRLEYQLWLAWHACKRTGQTGDAFEMWLPTVDAVGEEVPEPTPLPETEDQSTG